ncbi:MAG: phage head-tail connector protein [Streptosporangiales bacterium]
MLTLNDAKKAVNIDDTDTSQDDELQPYMDAVMVAVEHYTGELMSQQVVSEQHEARRQSSLMLYSLPVVAVTAVINEAGAQWDVDGLHVDKQTGRLVSLGRPFDGFVTVTLRAGYDIVPANYYVAALIILEQMWRTQRGPSTASFGDVPDFASGPTGFAIPRRAEEMLGPPLGGVA